MAIDCFTKALAEASAGTDRASRTAPISAMMRDSGAMEDLAAAGLAECEPYLMELSALPAMSSTASAVRRAIKDTMRAARSISIAEPGATPDPVRLADHLPPLKIPDRYALRPDGIFVKKETPDGIVLARVNRRPLVPSLVLADIDTSERSLQLSWVDRRGWSDRIVPSCDIQDPRAFVRLCNFGVPVAAHNSRLLAEFVDEVAEYNAETIPRAWATRRMGWMRDGALGFALGHRIIGSDSVRVELDPDGSETQIADALHAEGSEAAWLSAVKRATGHPSAMLALYASVCAPLLVAMPSAPNPIVGWCGETSSGKTTVLRLAASVWGNPDERSVGLVQKWNQTPVYLERFAAFCTSLPCCLDDTNDVAEKSRDMIARMIYQFAGGKGRGRGKPDGTRRTESWRAPLLSTGEAALTSYSQDAGARARTLVLFGPPFGAGSQEALVADLTLTCLDNYGHLGPRLVQHMIDTRKDWPGLALRYAAKCDALASTVDSTATKRLAKIVALLDMAKELGESCGLPTPANGCDPIAFAWDAAKSCGSDTDRPRAALVDVYGWAVSHASEFWGRHYTGADGTPARPPSKGWAGQWDKGEDWGRLVFKPECLHGTLRHLRYDPGAVLPLWEERGWLDCNEAGRSTYRVTVEDERVRWIGIKASAIRDVNG